MSHWSNKLVMNLDGKLDMITYLYLKMINIEVSHTVTSTVHLKGSSLVINPSFLSKLDWIDIVDVVGHEVGLHMNNRSYSTRLDQARSNKLARGK